MNLDLSQQELEILLAWYMNCGPSSRLDGSGDLMRRLRAAFDQAVQESERMRSRPERPRRGRLTLREYQEALRLYEQEVFAWREQHTLSEPAEYDDGNALADALAALENESDDPHDAVADVMAVLQTMQDIKLQKSAQTPKTPQELPKIQKARRMNLKRRKP